MITRLANVLYWFCSGVAVLCMIAGAVMLSMALTQRPDPGEMLVILAPFPLCALACWLLGRGIRYVLTGA